MLSTIEKDYIFSIIKENFGWISKDYQRHISCKFREEDREGFSLNWGTVKYCISGEVFPNYVVKFCLGGFDYCEREYTNYLAAIERKLGRFFPYTDFLGKFNGVSYYIQEKAYVDSERVSDIWYGSVSEDEYWESTYSDEDEEYVSERIWDYISDLEDSERIEILFGDDALIDFIDEYCINDLHEGNYGYIDDRLVIIDFSGYSTTAICRDF